MPRGILSRLGSDIAKALIAPEVKAKLTELSMVAVISTPDQFSTMVRDTDAIYQRIIKAGNIQLD